jgi:hypothetical protein
VMCLSRTGAGTSTAEHDQQRVHTDLSRLAGRRVGQNGLDAG